MDRLMVGEGEARSDDGGAHGILKDFERYLFLAFSTCRAEITLESPKAARAARQ
jgi:hypothetical protein